MINEEKKMHTHNTSIIFIKRLKYEIPKKKAHISNKNNKKSKKKLDDSKKLGKGKKMIHAACEKHYPIQIEYSTHKSFYK